MSIKPMLVSEVLNTSLRVYSCHDTPPLVFSVRVPHIPYDGNSSSNAPRMAKVGR
jgi:hypothetical protein